MCSKEQIDMANQSESREDTARIPSNEDVARRAYELFQACGGEPGHDLDHWLEAERELSQTSPNEAHDRSTRREAER
jgi:Protein of unknown function (DUF2934)